MRRGFIGNRKKNFKMGIISLKKFDIRLSNAVYDSVAKMSREKELPISWLIAIACDNEFSTKNPFEFKVDIPGEPPYLEGQYRSVAEKIFNYMRVNFIEGTGLIQWCLCRRDMGIESKEEFLLGFRELIQVGLVETYLPSETKFRYPEGYLFYRMYNDTRNTVRKNEEFLRNNKGPLDE